MHFADFGNRLLKHVADKIEAAEARITTGVPDWTSYREQLARLAELREMEAAIRSILGRDEAR